MTQKRKSIGVVEDCGSPARAAACTTAASTSTNAEEKNTQAVFETTPPLWTTAPAGKKAKIAYAAAAVASSSSSPDGGGNNAAEAQAQPSSTELQPPGAPKPAADRCSACRKKVGLLGFRCCCGETFCGTHRYAEKHACGFDYKRAGRGRIAKENPVVVADKIVKI